MNTTRTGLAAALVTLSLAAPAVFADASLPYAQAGQTGQGSGAQAQQQQPPAKSGGQAGAKAQKDAGALPPGHPPVIYTLVPITVADQDPAMKSGCWARFHDQQNFAGDMLTLLGPVDMPDMTGPFGIDWKDKISSIETGKKAEVYVYDNEKYQDLVATVKPGQKLADVSKKMGFFDEFSSIKISCGK